MIKTIPHPFMETNHPGTISAFIGAAILSSLPGDKIKPFFIDDGKLCNEQKREVSK